MDEIFNRLIQRESSGNPNAVSPKGAIGLGQIMPSTGAMYGASRQELFDPKINRYIARSYLDYLVDKYHGDIGRALAAYNTGPGNVDKGIIPPETRSYVGSILGDAVANQLSRFPQFNPMRPAQGPNLVTQAVQAAAPKVSQFVHSPAAQLGGLAALAVPGTWAALHGDVAPLEEVGEEAGPLLREAPPMFRMAGPAARVGAEQRLVAGWQKGFADYLGSNYEDLPVEARNRITAKIRELLIKTRRGEPIGSSNQIFRETFKGYAEQRAGDILGRE